MIMNNETRKILCVIPARGGSKGIPRKNIKPLNGKPLIEYTIDVARQVLPDEHICVSTDDDEIIRVVENYDLNVPFKRPMELATDTSGTYEVLLHALSYYESIGREYDVILLLQTTSPFRTASQVQTALSLYNSGIDMIVSVTETKSNPYYNVFEEDVNGFLKISKGDGTFIRRQETPKVWEYNGAIYVINVESLKRMPLGKFLKRKKFVMDASHSIDLDTLLDWHVAEVMLKNNLVKL